MKDFYDVLFFSQHYKFKKDTLLNAIITTFNHRSTDVGQRMMIYEDKFKLDESLQKLWKAFLERNRLTSVLSFNELIIKIQNFIEPVFDNKSKNNWNFEKWEWE
jgi:hypothetical protein